MRSIIPHSIALGLVVDFIKANLDHENKPTRDAILKALNEGMAQTFYEDNATTAHLALCSWIVDNDPRKEYITPVVLEHLELTP